MKAASQLIEKHQFRHRFSYESLDIRMTRIQSELKKGYVHYLENATDVDKCPIILLQLKFFKPQFTVELKTIAKGQDNSSCFTSLEDARRLCVYLTDLAVQSMEDNNANGVVFIIDAEECSLQQHFLETRMFTDLLQTMRSQYPEIVQHILILNCNAITRSLIHMLIKTQAADRTQLRVRLISNYEDLKHCPNAGTENGDGTLMTRKTMGRQYRLISSSKMKSSSVSGSSGSTSIGIAGDKAGGRAGAGMEMEQRQETIPA
ncbi:hypothetical protein ABG067_006158 [Albugo candida]